MLKKIIAKLFLVIKSLTLPKSKSDDLARKELILNILIIFSVVSFIILNIIRLIDLINNQHDRGLPIIFTLFILGFFIFLGFLSNKGFIKISAWLFIGIYSVPMIYSFLFWGADLPAALLMGVLIITLFGVLMGARSAIVSAAILNLFLIILTNFHITGIIFLNNYWRSEKHEVGDAITYAILMMVITVIVWIFDKQMKRALKRAHQSEQALMKERDDLEIKVEERTTQIKELEAEKIGQLYRLAEFGRLSSGVFHDLINPLTAVSLNLEQIKNEGENSLNDAKDCLFQAIAASHKMEDLISCIKRSLRQESLKITFSPTEEINSIIKILSYKSRKAGVELCFNNPAEINFYGDPVKFSQIIINLISNSIDACEVKPVLEYKKITIDLLCHNQKMILKVSDQGEGISNENLKKIFQPFFSTKSGRGFGLGLTSTKNIVEKDFGGSIEVESIIGQETIFTIIIPLSYAN